MISEHEYATFSSKQTKHSAQKENKSRSLSKKKGQAKPAR